MEDALRCIMIVVILYVIGMEIYKDVRSRTIDYLPWRRMVTYSGILPDLAKTELKYRLS